MTAYTDRLNDFERRLHGLERELGELRAAAPAAQPEPEPYWAAFAEPVVPPAPEIPAPRRAPRPAAKPEPPLVPAPPVRPPRPPRRELDLSFLFSARALAWTGGAVTLLGIVFFFVLSVQRGWIGPSLRVALGGVASAVVFGAGVWLRRRYGSSYSAYAAVGAGIAGGYATVLAAAALYHLLPAPVALALAGAIAAAGVATSLVWESETIAGLGLVGAMLVPVAVVFGGGLSTLGTAFVALMLAGAAAVAVWRRWWALLAVSAVASAPQIEVLMADASGRHGRVVVLAIAFWLVYAAAGVAAHFRLGSRELTAEPSAFVVLSGAFAGNACALLFDGTAQGTALLAVAAAYAGLAALLFVRERDLSALAAAVALAIGGVGAADLLNGDALTVAWAAEAAVLAWLARRTREIRFQLASLVWLGLALGHTIAFDALPARDFLAVTDTPARGLIAVVASAIAAVVVALHTGTWEDAGPQRGILRPLSRLLADLRAQQDALRVAAGWLAGAFALYGASLAILGGAQLAATGTRAAFDWGHVAVAALWAAAAVGAVRAGARWAGVTIAGASIALVAAFDATHLAQTPRACAFLAVAVGALAVSFDDEAGETIVVTLVAAALALGGFGAAWLLHGTPLALVWCAETAALAWAGARTRRLRLSLGAFAWLGVTLVHVAAVDAQPRTFLLQVAHPWNGVPALLGVAAAAFAVTRLLPARHELRPARVTATVVAGAAPLAAASLALLETAQRLGSWDWGHVAVAALWGAAGVAVTAAGRRTAGLALGVATLALAVEDVLELGTTPRSWALLVIAASALLIGFLAGRDRLELDGVGTLASLGLSTGGIVGLLDGRAIGIALLGVAAAHGILAAVTFRRRRDQSTLHWATALVVAVPASALVVHGTLLVLAWAAAAAGLALLGRVVGESRFEAASVAYLALAAAWTLGVEARPDTLFLVHAHPGLGAPAAAFVAAAAAVYASRWRSEAWWASGTFAVYGASLALLELFRHVGGASPELAYQRGHTAVSALWGVIGLVLLYSGLQRRVRALQLGGFALFGISLAKLFLYDLAFLSSVARAFSFLAVGAVLLLGGFFFQRLAVDSHA